jgi:hypothetical protein
MNEQDELKLTADDHRKAFTEVSFLLDIFIETMKALAGSGAPTVGTSAGRDMAKKLPIFLPHPTLEAVVGALAKQMNAGFEISAQVEGNKAALKFGRCALREVCTARAQQPGGELCKVFHYYFAGMATELLKTPVRPLALVAGAVCTAELQAR